MSCISDAMQDDMALSCKTGQDLSELLINSSVIMNGTVATAAASIGHSTPWLKQLRVLLYLMAPSELYFPTLEDTPNFMLQAVPLIVVLIFIEAAVHRLMSNADERNYNNYISNISAFAVQDACSQFIFRGAELMTYIWIYDHFRITTLPWDSVYTYVIALLAVDYCAYWWHRASHEVSLIWAAHEFHHNCEDFNLSITMRLSFTMRLFKWIFYIPTALMGLPVSTMWAHAQLGLIFNGFSHLSVIPSMDKVIPVIGHVIEYIFVTPAHHKMHHAMNEYALDKNYGNFLIIWDRLHGTFVEAKPEEELWFGSLTPLSTSSTIQLQNDPFVHLWEKMQSMTTFGDKLRALFYGPGWFPNRPRLGLKEEYPDMRGRPKWEMQLPMWLRLYLLVNCLSVFLIYVETAGRAKELSMSMQLFTFAYIYGSYWSLGAIFDYHMYGTVFEVLRVTVLLAVQCFSNTPLMVVPKFADICVKLALINLPLLPFVASHVYKVSLQPVTQQEEYVRKLEELNYLKPKSD